MRRIRRKKANYKEYTLIWVVIYALLLSGIITVFLSLVFLFIPKGGVASVAITDGWVHFEQVAYTGVITTSEVTVAMTRNPKLQFIGKFIIDNKEYYWENGHTIDVKAEKNFIPSVFYLISSDMDDYLVYNVGETPIYYSNQSISCYKYKDTQFYLALPEKTKIQFAKCSLLMDKHEIHEIEAIDGSVYFYSGQGHVEDTLPNYSIKWDGKEKLDFRNIKEINMSGSGLISFFNTAKAQDFELIGEADFVGEIKAKGNGSEIKVQGSITQAQINGYSIFPSFWDWIIENVYLIPSMVLTVFGGAISLAVSKTKTGK